MSYKAGKPITGFTLTLDAIPTLGGSEAIEVKGEIKLRTDS